MIELNQLNFVGAGLSRPECVLCTADSSLHIADWRGGVTIIKPDGTQETILAKGGFKPKPNGIAILREGGWLLAHLGDTDGGVYRLSPDGQLKPEILDVDGRPLPPTNYVHIDGQDRIWITVSTRRQPRALGYRKDCRDGFIILVDSDGARIVADDLGYTNECLVHPETGQLYVNETFSRRLTRFDVAQDGMLSHKTTIAQFGHGTFPDGLTFDVDGGVWITSIVSNRVIRVSPDGEQDVILQDAPSQDLDIVEKAYHASVMDATHLGQAYGACLKNISSAAFGGADLRTLYLGCLLGEELAYFQSPIQGLKPYHWDWFTMADMVQK